MESVREELRQELSQLGPRGRGRAYPKGLLERLLSYTVARRRQGATIVEVAAEVGMSFRTPGRWLGERKATAGFERVEVVAAPRALAPTSELGVLLLNKRKRALHDFIAGTVVVRDVR